MATLLLFRGRSQASYSLEVKGNGDIFFNKNTALCAYKNI